jgi:hypothetical protein
VRLNPIENLKVDATNINEEFSQLPLLIYRYTEMWESARETASLLEAAVEEAEGEEYVRIKSEGEKVTEAHLKALIQVSKKVKAAREAYLSAKKDAGTLFGVLEGLRSKKDALVTIGANQRAEQK